MLGQRGNFIMQRKCIVLCVGMAIIFSACAPTIQELRSTAPIAHFNIKASYECLYNKGVEHVTSQLPLMEPRFDYHIDSAGGVAWFRQPLTIIEIRRMSDKESSITLQQTPSAEAFGQGQKLIQFLKSNPCSSE